MLLESDQQRLALAQQIDMLPGICQPKDDHGLPAGSLLTPLVACLDPDNRFPVVNGRKGVVRLLSKVEGGRYPLRAQVKELLDLLTELNISDAFKLDVCAGELNLLGTTPSRSVRDEDGKPLPCFDELERTASLDAQTVTYRKRHNKMTNAIRDRFRSLRPKEGKRLDNRFDILLRNYDQAGRDLLIEAKPDPDKASLRVAIGQLFDYRRGLQNRLKTDLAILTIGKPTDPYLKLMQELNINALWFDAESCQSLRGSGPALNPLQAAAELRSRSAKAGE
jgi:hypothetical protein